jgi:hypothetical protein
VNDGIHLLSPYFLSWIGSFAITTISLVDIGRTRGVDFRGCESLLKSRPLVVRVAFFGPPAYNEQPVAHYFESMHKALQLSKEM